MTGKVQQLHEFRNLVMLESVFGRILSGCLNADGNENDVINTNVTHVCVVLRRIDITMKLMFINFRDF